MDESAVTLVVGPAGGGRIEFRDGVGDGSRAGAGAFACDSAVVWSGGRQGEEWIVGESERGVVRLIRGRDTSGSVLDALREVELSVKGSTQGLGAVFGALIAAEKGLSQGMADVSGSPALFAQLAEGDQLKGGSNWDEATLGEQVEGCLEGVMEGRGVARPEAGPLDSARFWITMGERLWGGTERGRLGKTSLGESSRRVLTMVAGAWMELQPEGRVVVRGSHFRLRGAARRMAWPQVMEWEAGEVDLRALKYLTAYHSAYRFDGILAGLLGVAGTGDEGVPALVAASESRVLLEEAALKWVCDPYGSFRVDLPPRTPMTRWGVTSLRVWIVRGQGFWVALEAGDQPGASLEWCVGPPHLRRWVLTEQTLPGVHLTMSALWRDLKLGGKDVILSGERPGGKEVDAKEGARLRLHGRIRWGSEDELKQILREAYPVEEHLRVLPRGKRATRRAYRQALSHGHILKPGTTFVRGHRRGKPDETVENVPVKAQGLARLIQASRVGVEKQVGVGTR
jgi:hypothetical protein